MATTNKIAMHYVVYQNTTNNEKTRGKFYARPLVTNTLSLKGFARHIHDHSGTFKTSTLKGVLEEMVECLIEMVSQGVGVKLDGLGTFYPTFECTGADSADEFDINQNLKGVHMRFKPERTKDEDITSRSFKQKCIMKRLQSVDALASTDSGSDSEEPIVENPGD